MSQERDIYYTTLQNALAKGMDEHDARKAAYIASQAGKTETKPTSPRRRKKK